MPWQRLAQPLDAALTEANVELLDEHTVRGTIARLFLDWRGSEVSSAGLDTPRRSMSTGSPWIFRGVEDRMRVVVTGSQAHLGGAKHQPLTASSMLAAGSGPFSAGSGSIDERPRPR
jgi:hypothetical protein